MDFRRFLVFSLLGRVFALQSCKYDSECRYVGCGGLQRCCPSGYCISAGSCLDNNPTFCPEPMFSVYPEPIRLIYEKSNLPSSQSSTTYPETHNSISKNPTRVNSQVAQVRVDSPAFASPSQESSPSSGSFTSTIFVPGCNPLCYQPTTCTTCSGTAMNASGTTGGVNQLHFCCDLSGGLNFQICRAKAGCPASPSSNTNKLTSKYHLYSRMVCVFFGFGFLLQILDVRQS
jgi:hypothetical protein